MSEIKVKIYPASNGESILIKCKEKNQTNILVDCGYVSTYNNHIRNDLIELKKRNEKIDLLILTHIDNDHINGARNLMSDYSNNEICDISEIWYNDYFSIYNIESNNIEMCKTEFNLFRLLKDDGYPFDPNEIGEKNISFKSANILVDYLEKDIIKKRLNKSFENAVFVDEKSKVKRVIINNEVEIIVLGPKKEILLQLLNDWRNYLINIGFKKEITKSEEMAKAFELFYVNKMEKLEEESCFDKECSVNSTNDDLMAYLDFDIKDKKVENRSSIAFILKFYDKHLLFLGDSSPIDYEEALDFVLKNKKGNFELVKVAHHGSKYNTSKKLFEMIKSKRYVISTNGSVFNHPDLETISKIAIKQEDEKKIYFNYRIPKVEEFFKVYNLQHDKCMVSYGNDSLLGENIQLIEIKGEGYEL